jgi:hypothetical protein
MKKKVKKNKTKKLSSSKSKKIAKRLSSTVRRCSGSWSYV